MAENQSKRTYVEVDPSHLDEGEFARRFQSELREAFRQLQAYETATGDMTAKATLNIKINMSRVKGSQEFLELDYAFSRKVPAIGKSTSVRAAQGHLLVDPDGDSLNDKDQLQMHFDRHGNKVEVFDPKTGEVIS